MGNFAAGAFEHETWLSPSGTNVIVNTGVNINGTFRPLKPCLPLLSHWVITAIL